MITPPSYRRTGALKHLLVNAHLYSGQLKIHRVSAKVRAFWSNLFVIIKI